MSNATEWLDKLDQIRPLVHAAIAEVQSTIAEARIHGAGAHGGAGFFAGGGAVAATEDAASQLTQLQQDHLEVVAWLRACTRADADGYDLSAADVVQLEGLFANLKQRDVLLPESLGVEVC
ncbi:MAG: hypothetical protein P1U40_10175 [Coxiellaceae bacterium]|nr:hypothetical protein [Coxiellaceae bacterium]